ncbi:hypothetical protein LU11_gp374 [Pseudomonas phage Lu11]|uniref:hypothetical protein n=1 Tax=Pseudomonas phage Lu11 TaxID=1161927 RepID=UPI00025F18D3|nr:hypothetical protein LU11_gp374 [Pseudomonas phage Lu11]AFH14905.1 hypothetical protein Lu11_0367 [Pseudomonas phage Lu11]
MLTMKRKLLITCKWVLFVICTVVVINALSLVAGIAAIFIIRPFVDVDPDYGLVEWYIYGAAGSAIVYWAVLNPLYVRTKIKINKLVEK